MPKVWWNGKTSQAKAEHLRSPDGEEMTLITRQMRFEPLGASDLFSLKRPFNTDNMKTRYTLETLQEVKNAACNIRLDGDPLPVLTGTLEALREEKSHSVKLVGDPNFEFQMPFKDFVLQACEMAGIKLMARDHIPG